MGLDMDFYKLPKGTVVSNFKELMTYKSFKYFRKNYSIHEIMCLSAALEYIQAKNITDEPMLPYPYLYGGGEYQITSKQYEYIKKILATKNLSKYIEDYDEEDNPKQLLKILKDFDKYDFWYSWCN